MTNGKQGPIVKLLERSGAGFKRQFDFTSYKKFFEEAGYKDVSYRIVEGRMPCAIAPIKKVN